MGASELSWQGVDSKVVTTSCDCALITNRNTISSNLYLLHDLLSQAPGARHRFGSHLRLFAGLQRYLRSQLKAEQPIESLALAPLLASLTRQLQRIAGNSPLILHTETAGALPLKQCLSFLMVLNELVANAEKHGAGEVTVSLGLLTCPPGTISSLLCLEVSDSGKGFPKDFASDTHAKLGLEIVDVLCRWDLEGELILQNIPDGGARVQVYFPLNCS
ncbi:MAG: ATP-binding protein [Armatimonas sp.]